MPLTAADFIEPTGELSTDLFPGRDLTAFVTAWLAEATERAGSESAQRAWVYHRAYSHVANRFNLEASSEGKGSENAQRLFSQIDYWRKRAAQQQAEFDALTGRTPGAFLQPTGIE